MGKGVVVGGVVVAGKGVVVGGVVVADKGVVVGGCVVGNDVVCCVVGSDVCCWVVVGVTTTIGKNPVVEVVGRDVVGVGVVGGCVV